MQDKKKKRCLVISIFPCYIERFKKLFLVITLIMGKVPNLNFLKGEVKVPHEPAGS